MDRHFDPVVLRLIELLKKALPDCADEDIFWSYHFVTGSLMLTSSGATKRLDRLERAGLVERTPDPDDRRGVIITLTEAGHELIDRVTEAHMANENRLLGGLGADEREQLADLLRKLGLSLPPLP